MESLVVIYHRSALLFLYRFQFLTGVSRIDPRQSIAVFFIYSNCVNVRKKFIECAGCSPIYISIFVVDITQR